MNKLLLDENQVCKLVCADLKKRDFKITQECLHTSQQGFDLKTKKGDINFFIECKGATSSKETSKRFGKEFDNRQIKTHISKALFQSACAISRSTIQEEIEAGIALPKTKSNIDCIRKIKLALCKFGITIIWVHKDGRIEPHSPPSSKIQWAYPSLLT